jgi:hypothetical protein
MCIAVTGLLLAGVNIVVPKATRQCVRRYAVARASTELREVFDPKNIAKGQATKEKYEAFSLVDVLAQGFVGGNNFLSERFIRSKWNGYRDGGVRENDAWGMESLMWMPDAEITNRGIIVFLENRSDHVSLNFLRRSFPAINYLRDCLKLGSVRWEGVWKRHTYPSALIYSHSLSCITGLREVGGQSDYRNESGDIKSPVLQETVRVFLCLFHIIFFFVVGMFQTQHVVDACRGGRWILALFLLTLVAVSAAHVLEYMFRFLDACTTTLFT